MERHRAKWCDAYIVNTHRYTVNQALIPALQPYPGRRAKASESERTGKSRRAQGRVPYRPTDDEVVHSKRLGNKVLVVLYRSNPLIVTWDALVGQKFKHFQSREGRIKSWGFCGPVIMQVDILLALQNGQDLLRVRMRQPLWRQRKRILIPSLVDGPMFIGFARIAKSK